jgi:hypothetical protein
MCILSLYYINVKLHLNAIYPIIINEAQNFES